MEVGLEAPSKRVFSVGDHDEACTGLHYSDSLQGGTNGVGPFAFGNNRLVTNPIGDHPRCG